VEHPKSTLRPYQPGWWVQRLILGYRKAVSPALGQHCRYLPSCSEYAFEAVDAHGTLKGGWLAVRRVGRCHPFREGGYDPVPPRRAGRGSRAS
jgi:putative membrane protein insertion efficiency factor